MKKSLTYLIYHIIYRFLLLVYYLLLVIKDM